MSVPGTAVAGRSAGAAPSPRPRQVLQSGGAPTGAFRHASGGSCRCRSAVDLGTRGRLPPGRRVSPAAVPPCAATCRLPLPPPPAPGRCVRGGGWADRRSPRVLCGLAGQGGGRTRHNASPGTRRPGPADPGDVSRPPARGWVPPPAAARGPATVGGPTRPPEPGAAVALPCRGDAGGDGRRRVAEPGRTVGGRPWRRSGARPSGVAGGTGTVRGWPRGVGAGAGRLLCRGTEVCR